MTRCPGLPALALALAALGAAPLGAQLPRSSPAAAGFRPEVLARTGTMLREAVDSGRIAGGVLLVARGGKLVAMILVEEGRLLLTDPASRYIPELRRMQVLLHPGTDSARRVDARRQITVRDLLTHRAGFVYGFSEGPIAAGYREAGISDGLARDGRTMADNVALLARQPLAHHPGERFTYGLSTDVLGRVIEVASGRTLDEFFRERIFRPLGMTDTRFYLDDAQLPRLATPYFTDSTGTLVVMADSVFQPNERFTVAGKLFRGSPRFFSGGGGLVGTTGDYARFLQMLLNGGELDGARILGPRTVAWLTATNQLGDLANRFLAPGEGFSLGFRVTVEPGLTGSMTSAGTFSWGGAYGTSYWVDPREQLVVVFMQQNPTVDGRLRPRLLNAVYAALLR